MCTVLYLRPHGRRPVWVSPAAQPDAQGAIPAWWCEECGAEVFVRTDRLCRRCGEMRKECMRNEYQSLFDLCPGGEPDGM